MSDQDDATGKSNRRFLLWVFLGWKEGRSISQNYGVLTIVILLYGSIIPIFFESAFSPSILMLRIAYASSFLLTIIFLAVFYLSWIRGTHEPSSEFKIHTRREQKLLLVVGVPFFIYGLFLVNLSLTYPILYTWKFGDKVTIKDTATKRMGSKRTCEYQYRPQSNKNFFFLFCVSGKDYFSIKKNEFDAKLNVTQSVLGYYVETIEEIH